MTISILDPLRDKQGGIKKSANWYKTNVMSLGNRATASQLMRSGRLTGVPSRGRLNMFFYDPKYKKTLPLYDRFPLVLPIETISGGFMGLNFHYLRPGARFVLLEQLQKFASGKFDKKTRIDATYDGIKSIGIAKTTIKKYLYGHVRSSFLRVDFDEAAMAIYLPVAQFKKGRPY